MVPLNNDNYYSIVFERHGGIGDVAFTSAVLRYFRFHEDKIINAAGKPLKIIYSTQKRNWFLLDNLQVNGKRIIDEKIDLFPLSYPRRGLINSNGESYSSKDYKIPIWLYDDVEASYNQRYVSYPHKNIVDDGFVGECVKNLNSLKYKPDVCCSFFEIIERNAIGNFKNAYDYHFEWAGIDPDTVSPEDKLPVYSIRDREAKDAEKILKHCPGANKFRIGVQIHSSSLPRTWDKFDKLLLALCGKYPYAAVYSFGDPHAQVLELVPQERPRNYMPLAGKSHGDGRLWASLIGGMDLLVSVDSGALHIAGALGIPLVGIFSTVRAFTRIQYYKNAVGVDSKYHCSPCHHIGLQCLNSVPVPGQHFKPSLNIAGKNSAYPCLASITVDEVMAAVEQLIGR